jgi:hypothetical protein
MPLRKFHSVAEMNQPVWRRPSDPELFEAIRYPAYAGFAPSRKWTRLSRSKPDCARSRTPLHRQHDLAPFVRRTLEHLVSGASLFERKHGSDVGDQLPAVNQFGDLV